MNWEKIAKERGEEIVALKMQVQDLIETRGDLERQLSAPQPGPKLRELSAHWRDSATDYRKRAREWAVGDPMHEARTQVADMLENCANMVDLALNFCPGQ